LNAYLFGRHSGDLPLHLLEKGEKGNRIRAMAQLDGPDHTIFVAMELPHVDAGQQHVESLTTSGVSPGPIVVMCGSETCLSLLLSLVESVVAELEGFLVYLYLRLVVRGRVEILRDLVEELGHERVRAITDGTGTVIIEIGAHDRNELEQVAKRVLAEPYVAEGTAHYGVAKHHAQ
jgi:hypothetical protein